MPLTSYVSPSAMNGKQHLKRVTATSSILSCPSASPMLLHLCKHMPMIIYVIILTFSASSILTTSLFTRTHLKNTSSTFARSSHTQWVRIILQMGEMWVPHIHAFPAWLCYFTLRYLHGPWLYRCHCRVARPRKCSWYSGFPWLCELLPPFRRRILMRRILHHDFTLKGPTILLVPRSSIRIWRNQTSLHYCTHSQTFRSRSTDPPAYRCCRICDIWHCKLALWSLLAPNSLLFS